MKLLLNRAPTARRKTLAGVKISTRGGLSLQRRQEGCCSSGQGGGKARVSQSGDHQGRGRCHGGHVGQVHRQVQGPAKRRGRLDRPWWRGCHGAWGRPGRGPGLAADGSLSCHLRCWEFLVAMLDQLSIRPSVVSLVFAFLCVSCIRGTGLLSWLGCIWQFHPCLAVQCVCLSSP